MFPVDISDVLASIRPIMDRDDGTGGSSICAAPLMDASNASPFVRPTVTMATRMDNQPGGVATITNVATSVRTGGDTICAVFLSQGDHARLRGLCHDHRCLCW